MLIYAEAERLFGAIFGNAWDDKIVTWSFYSESKTSRIPGVTAFRATLGDAWPAIEKWIPSTNVGAVAMCPNPASGTKNVDVDSITHVRIDLDGVAVPEWAPPPTAHVLSYPPKRTRQHLYYRLAAP